MASQNPPNLSDERFFSRTWIPLISLATFMGAVAVLKVCSSRKGLSWQSLQFSYMRILPYSSRGGYSGPRIFLYAIMRRGYSVFRSHMADTLDLVAFGERLGKTTVKRR